MSITKFVTDISTMDTASSRVEEVANAIAQELRSLDNRIQPVTSQWRGDAATAYMSLHQTWIEDTSRLRQTLSEIAEVIKVASKNYKAQEDAVAAGANRIKGAL
jgi:WXG100 family type VII secretion target